MQEYLYIAIFLVVSILPTVLGSRWSKGRIGEARVAAVIRKALRNEAFLLSNDVLLPTTNGTTQIDHIVICRYGIFVVETKNMKGVIYCGAYESKWMQVLFMRRHPFQNPIRQNYKHLKTVQEILRLESHQIHSVVAFVGSATPKTPIPEGVVFGVTSLAQYMKKSRMCVIDESDLKSIARQLSKARLGNNFWTRRTHVKQLARSHSIRRSAGQACPRCGAAMVERANRQSGDTFMGCSRYPNCRGTRSHPYPR